MDLRHMIRAHTDVALTMTKHISQGEAKGTNLIFSPLSIHVLLSLISTGSSGPTLHELLSLLNAASVDHLASFASQVVSLVSADGGPKGGPRLSVANGLWVDASLPLKQSFKQVVDDAYKATTAQLDFQNNPEQAAAEVNSWAEKETSGLIKGILPPGSIDNSTRLILANALYFKGAWNEEFDASRTRDDDFHLLDGGSVKAPFMTSKKKQVAGSYPGLKVLALHYAQGEDKQRRFSMYFFLPDAKDGLPALIEQASSEPMFLERHLPFRPVEVGDFRIPKFKIEFEFEASDVLKGLGVVSAFTGGGLTEMVDSPAGGQNLYVSNVFHKSFMEVNEEGTEAAGVTVGVIAERFSGEKIDFVADHPFLYVVREDATGALLFVGHLLNPLQG